MAQRPTSIHVNPKFVGVHFNPNFLQRPSPHTTKILLNPNFIPPLPVEPPPPELCADANKPPPPPEPAPSSAIIRNTRRSLIRASALSRLNVQTTQSNQKSNQTALPRPPQQQLIKLGNNKVVNANYLMDRQQKENEQIKNATISIIQSKKLRRRIADRGAAESVYKLDRRDVPVNKKKIIRKFSIKRVDATSPKKVAGAKAERSSANKSLKLLNISGVLYKSTSKKLERKSSLTSLPSEQQLLIRGSKFILDTSGKRLRLESEGTDSKMSRIDIGGLTYKASKDGSFERDNSHQVRNHLTLAKTKSISVLAKSRFQKTNAVCQIYRRLGKCIAYANGRCQMLHDPRYVVVCPDFIRGSCSNEKCLRSHNANLHKMPVCNYFLQGLCNKENCLFLHKKLSDDAKPCAEFLKGYCPLADQCNLLHAFPTNKSLRRKPKKAASKEASKTAAETERYYFEDSAPAEGENAPKRRTLGSLPSFIPI